MTSYFFFLIFNVDLFLRERDRARVREEQRERGRHSIRSRLQALSCQHRAWCWAQTHELWDRDLSHLTDWATQAPHDFFSFEFSWDSCCSISPEKSPYTSAHMSTQGTGLLPSLRFSEGQEAFLPRKGKRGTIIAFSSRTRFQTHYHQCREGSVLQCFFGSV